MKHLGINQLLVASAILAPALASDNSKTDKVTMPLAEVEKQETMSMSLDESSSKAAKVTTAPVSSSIESPQSALSKSGKSSSGNTGNYLDVVNRCATDKNFVWLALYFKQATK